MSRYAETTSVGSDKSRAEIERTLARYGAESFMYGWDADRALIGFVKDGRQIRFLLPMPNRQAREFTHTPARNTRRSDAQAEQAFEQAVRQRWPGLRHRPGPCPDARQELVMTPCPRHPFGDPDGLDCTRDAADHEPGHGCTYESTSGVPDRHDTGVPDE